MDMKKDRSFERSFDMQKWKGREVGIRSGGNGFYERARRAESLARCGERFFYFFVETRVGHRVSKGDFAL